MNDERMQILKMVEAGQITTEEAVTLLDALDADETSALLPAVVDRDQLPLDHPDPGGWWIYPTAAGAVVMAVGAPLMALGLTGRAATFWALFCGWIPFFLGLGILTLGVWSRNARWFHLRVKEAHSGQDTFVLSLPLPLTLTAWALRLVGRFVPQLQDTAIDEAILALRDTAQAGTEQPLYIDVQDDDGGEHVMIYIG